MNKDLIRLKHMQDSTNAILRFMKGKSRADLRDRLLSSAVIREFEIIGEAAGRVSQETKERFPHLPWKQLSGLRNRLIHAYFDVDYDIVWKTINDSLPSFQAHLGKAITEF